MASGQLVSEGRQPHGPRHDAECETCARFRDGLLGAADPARAGTVGTARFGRPAVGTPVSIDCLAEMYGDLCDEIYRRWISGFGRAGGWETRFDMAVEAGLDC